MTKNVNKVKTFLNMKNVLKIVEYSIDLDVLCFYYARTYNLNGNDKLDFKRDSIDVNKNQHTTYGLSLSGFLHAVKDSLNHNRKIMESNGKHRFTIDFGYAFYPENMIKENVFDKVSATHTFESVEEINEFEKAFEEFTVLTYNNLPYEQLDFEDELRNERIDYISMNENLNNKGISINENEIKLYEEEIIITTSTDQENQPTYKATFKREIDEHIM